MARTKPIRGACSMCSVSFERYPSVSGGRICKVCVWCTATEPKLNGCGDAEVDLLILGEVSSWRWKDVRREERMKSKREQQKRALLAAGEVDVIRFMKDRGLVPSDLDYLTKHHLMNYLKKLSQDDPSIRTTGKRSQLIQRVRKTIVETNSK